MQAGDVIGRFRVVSLLNDSGLVKVYKVRQQRGTVHVLRLLPVQNREQKERLLRESHVLTRLHHPNLVPVTEVVEQADTIGRVTAYVHGFSLAHCLQEGGGMPLQDALEIFGQVLAAVGAAHAAGLLHRSLSPENILLTARANHVLAMVDNFGIAGIPGYMSPEQITEAATDRRTDIFSLGAILYELLSGSPAFQGDSVLAVLNNTVRGSFTPLQMRTPDCPPEIVDAVVRALEVMPEDRFPSCEAFAEALERITEPKQQTEPSSDDPVDWGLDQVQIDENLPAVHFEDMLQRIARERQRAQGQVDETQSPEELNLGGRLDSWLVSILWPIMSRFGSIVRFILAPGIGLAVLTLWAGRHGAHRIDQARTDLDLARSELVNALAHEQQIADEAEALGARSEVLRPFRERHETATTDGERIRASRDLTDVLQVELGLLPTSDDSEKELARRDLEIQLNENARRHTAYQHARSSLDEQSSTPFAQIARTFDMAP